MTSRPSSCRAWRLHPLERVPPKPLNKRDVHAAAVEKWKWMQVARRAPKLEREAAEIDEVLGAWRGCSSLAWPSISILGLILAVVTMVSLVQSVDRREATVRKGNEIGGSPGIMAIPRVPKVTRFEVTIGHDGLGKPMKGVVGQTMWEAHHGDLTWVSAVIDAPAYCYLVSLTANGGIDVVDPPGMGIVPEPTDVIRYPRVPEHVARLSQGPGLQGFLLFVSREPLPAFVDWPPGRQLRWRSTQVSTAWRWDGKAIDRLEKGGVSTPARFFDAPPALSRVCDMIQRFEGVDASELIAFPVRLGVE